MNWEVKVLVPTEQLSKVLLTIEDLHLMYEIIQAEAFQRKPAPEFADVIIPSGKSMAEKVADVIRDEVTGEWISKADVIALIKQVGGNPGGISYYVGNLRTAGVIGKYDYERRSYKLL